MPKSSKEKKDTHVCEPVGIDDLVLSHARPSEDDICIEAFLKAIADGKLTKLEKQAIKESPVRRFNSMSLRRAFDVLSKKNGTHPYFQEAVIVPDEATRKLVLSDTAQEVAREGVARIYARKLMGLLQEMSECTAETRRAIADEIVTSIGTDEYIQRKEQEGQKAYEIIEDGYTERYSEGYKDIAEWRRTNAQKMVSGSRQMLGEISEVLKRKA